MNYLNYKNPEKRKEYLKKYRSKNPEKYRYISEARKRQRRFNPVTYLLHGTRARAKKKGIEHTITKNDLILPEYCPVFPWIKLECGKIQQDASPSVDRIDNNKGYVPGNVRIISWRANNLKSNMTLKEYKHLDGWII